MNNQDQIWNKKVVDVARHAIRTLDHTNIENNDVIVFDVDETLLDSNYNVITPILNVYFYARMIGIKIAIITARDEQIFETTKEQLYKAGITHVDFYYFRSANMLNPWTYKHNARIHLIMQGYRIIMSIGDQDWDIIGNEIGVGVKVPINDISILSNEQYIKYNIWPGQEKYITS